MVSKGQRREPCSLKRSYERRLLKRHLTGPCYPGWSCTGVGAAPGGCDQNTGVVSWPGVPTAHETCLSSATSN